MSTFAQRRIRSSERHDDCRGDPVAVGSARERQLTSSSFATGYILLAAVLFLALYNVRKKLPFLPLGRSATWLQWHLYVGIASVGVFVLHAGLRWPTGILQTTLAACYVCTVVSGLVGLYLTRTIPAQLARVGEECSTSGFPHCTAKSGRRPVASCLKR